MAKVFSTHPMTDDRIRAAQKNIQNYLVAKPEYVVTTSEFNDVKNRLLPCTIAARSTTRTLTSRSFAGHPDRATGPVDADENGKTPKSDEDERPTLKRRPDSSN